MRELGAAKNRAAPLKPEAPINHYLQLPNFNPRTSDGERLMAKPWPAGILTLTLLGATLGATGACVPERERDRGPGLELGVAFEDHPRPDILSRTGNAIRDRDPEATPGLWGVVPGLARAETALVESTTTGASIALPLFSGSTGTRDIAIRLSPQAADALGILEAPVPVRITALRREPVLLQ